MIPQKAKQDTIYKNRNKHRFINKPKRFMNTK